MVQPGVRPNFGDGSKVVPGFGMAFKEFLEFVAGIVLALIAKFQAPFFGASPDCATGAPGRSHRPLASKAFHMFRRNIPSLNLAGSLGYFLLFVSILGGIGDIYLAIAAK